MKKHILIISQCFYPEQFRINDIAAEWVRSGHRVTVLTGIPNYPQGKFYPGYGWRKKRKEVWNGVEIIRIPLIARGKTAIGMVLNYLSFVVSGFFWKCFTKIKADLVFTFEVSPATQALIGVWYAKKRKVPNYLYVQDLWPEAVELVTGIHSKLVISPITKMMRYIYRNCDKIFATSQSLVKKIQGQVEDEQDTVCYWPQYAEDFYAPTEERSALIPQDGILNITFTGNIGVAQGLEILPKAARLLKESGLAVRFNIVGDGRNKENLFQQIEMLGVRDCFNLIGWQPATAIPSILAASDAAFLSFADTPLYAMMIPAKLQSYMACGCPILASAGGETERIIRDSGSGIVSEIGSAECLCDAIVAFMHLNAEERQKMRSNALCYCKKHFDKALLMREMEEDLLQLGKEPLQIVKEV